MAQYFVPTKFIWRFGGNQVHLCGSFTRWVETVPMTALDGQPGTFTVVVHLPPGYHQYKFIVDGEWRHDESQPFMPDPLGNVNNWLFVRKPEGQAAPAAQQGHNAGGGLHQSLQQHSQQQQPQQQQLDQLHPAAQQVQQHSPHHSQHPQQGVLQHQQSGPGGTAPSSRTHSVADMDLGGSGEAGIGGGSGFGGGSGGGASGTQAGAVIAPSSAQAEEPMHSKRKVADFLNHHSAYELIPESGKVVLLDTDLPMRQAFHALHEQGIASAPLWDGEGGRVCGMLSASDFIRMLQRLRSVVSSSANPMSEQEMDLHTIRALREELVAEGVQAPKKLVAVRPNDTLASVVRTLFECGCSMAPVLAQVDSGKQAGAASQSPAGGPTQAGTGALFQPGAPSSPTSASAAAANCLDGDVLHTATISGVLACLMRHFRASLASLPLLAQPLSALPIGTWSPGTPLAAGIPPQERQRQQQGNGADRRRGQQQRRVSELLCVRLDTPLTQALGLLLEAGVSCLPVVDSSGVLLDVYARADITMLAKGNAYARLQFEDVTVGQALALAGQPLPPPQVVQGGGGATPPQWGSSPRGSTGSLTGEAGSGGGGGNGGKQHRLHVCTPHDSLRTVVELLSVPGVRRLVVVDGDSRRVLGIVSLSDVAAFLLL
ncbi:hypothetical protein D9Q98_009607 [Chlorella vulgaris]|uniref:CBS domain-containing protein n=1 Tax=Chlorella vulgaris TaxID=3077 RepID=A0A9D4YSP7_CHLVU|nr:hypothetical protein D9Q98_009607 [Chlorella vulgaris]